MREPRNLKQHTASPAKIQMLLERVQLSPEKQHAYAKRLVLCAQGSQFAGVAPVWLRNLLKSTRGPHQSVNLCTLWARGSHRSDTVPDLLHRKQPASQRGDPLETEHHSLPHTNSLVTTLQEERTLQKLTLLWLSASYQLPLLTKSNIASRGKGKSIFESSSSVTKQNKEGWIWY